MAVAYSHQRNMGKRQAVEKGELQTFPASFCGHSPAAASSPSPGDDGGKQPSLSEELFQQGLCDSSQRSVICGRDYIYLCVCVD